MSYDLTITYILNIKARFCNYRNNFLFLDDNCIFLCFYIIFIVRICDLNSHCISTYCHWLVCHKYFIICTVAYFMLRNFISNTIYQIGSSMGLFIKAERNRMDLDGCLCRNDVHDHFCMGSSIICCFWQI